MPADYPSPGGPLGRLASSWAIIVPVVVLTGLLAWVPGLASIGPVDRDEPRYAQASKQMLETGDFVDIRLGDAPRYKKPIGIHWLQATTATVIGDGAASPLWVYRLPSLAGALAAALLTAVLGAAMFNRTVGLLAGLAMTSLLILGVEARLAKTDAVLLAVLVLMQLALWFVWSRRDQPAKATARWWPVFWIALGLAILVKGPVGPALAALTLGALVLFARRLDWLLRLRPLRGALIAFLIVAPWAIAVLVATDGAIVQGVKADAIGKIYEVHEGHNGPPGFYVLTGLGTAWPLVALAPLAAVWAWRVRATDEAQFLVAWMVPFWLLFEIAATKLPHYTMPAYPALAIGVAAAVLQLDRRRPWLIGVPLALTLAVGLALVGICLIAPSLLNDRLPAVVAGGAIAGASLLVLVWWAYVGGRFQLAGATMLAAAITLYATTYGGLFPRLEALQLSGRMAAAVETFAPCDGPVIASAGYHEPSALFLIGTDTRLVNSREAADILVDDACALVFVDTLRRAELEAELDDVPVRRLAEVDGWRLNEGGFTTITLFGQAP